MPRPRASAEEGTPPATASPAETADASASVDRSAQTTAAGSAEAQAAADEPINVAVADRVAALQALEVPAAGALPPGWDIRTSRSTGDTYYLNLVTEESTDERPTASALPDGWTHGISSSTGYLYFVSPSGESTYDNPWDAKRGGIKSFGGGLLSKGKAKAAVLPVPV